ncbi:YqiA/YcfP family alpha/beta fold hydrolase [Hahella ganghwensis]|uniref:YqiA/YcfP family alpha/beta fold hydrolase n=1 Tax=Hahella ganghwensis TaxID=286420 RepID=UPI000360EA7D|nr:YqiA/YcfP family alpha/beta fold hydrolase [Hahella ganghwensis]
MADLPLTTPFLLYLHGFKSSPDSIKAQVVKRWIARRRPDLRVEIPALPFSPKATIRYLETTYFQGSPRPMGIIGSSLGGYYAAYLSHIYGVPVAMINPAVRPYLLLNDYLGPNQNLYTGEVFEVSSMHMEELIALDIQPEGLRGQYLTLVQTGDDTLNYREALEKFGSHSMWIMPQGSHEFDGFEQVLPAIVNHLEAFR